MIEIRELITWCAIASNNLKSGFHEKEEKTRRIPEIKKPHPNYPDLSRVTAVLINDSITIVFL